MAVILFPQESVQLYNLFSKLPIKFISTQMTPLGFLFVFPHEGDRIKEHAR